ncbi:MAG: hypothetical protein RBQ97_05490, partial [Acholeplasma sp.]|nr:hypothetical protein [Acholeplasma sp.]
KKDLLSRLVSKEAKDILYIALSKYANHKLIESISLKQLFDNNEKITVNVYIDSENKYKEEFILLLGQYIIEGRSTVEMIFGIEQPMISINHNSLITFFSSREKFIMFSHERIPKSHSRFIKGVFDGYSIRGQKIYRRLLKEVSYKLTELINRNIIKTNNPIFFVKHPHYTSFAIESSFSSCSNETKRDALQEIIDQKQRLAKSKIICSINDFTNNDEEFIVHGMSVFANELIKYSSFKYQEYLKNLLLIHKNQFNDYLYVKFDLPYYLTVFDELVILYGDYHLNDDCIIYITKPEIVRRVKKIVYDFISNKKDVFHLDEETIINKINKLE